VVLFLDDVHWADVALLDLLHYAGQSWAESGLPILVLLCARSEVLPSSHALVQWIAGLKRALPLTELTPGPLTLEETVQLISAIGSGSPGDVGRPVWDKALLEDQYHRNQSRILQAIEGCIHVCIGAFGQEG